jgi:hypothetical protein
LLALIPALFGILTMPGGALMSVPFNEPEADRLKLKPEYRTFINIWFRHVWFWASPINTSTLLACSIAGIALLDFIKLNLPIFVLSWIIGFAMTWAWIKGEQINNGGVRDYKGSLIGLSPIIVTVALTLVGSPIWSAVIVGIIMVVLMQRVNARRAFDFVVKGVKLDIVAAVFATLFFRYMVVDSGSVNILLGEILGLGIPLLALFIIVPLLVGSISAQPTLGIGIVFPILMPLVAPINIYWMTIMFAGIVAGYTGSPLHLCLILTNQYCKSDLNKVYRYLIPSLILLFSVAIVYHVVLSGMW